TRVAEALLFVSVLLGTGMALYLWHRSTIGMSVMQDSVTYLQSSADKVVRRDVLFPGLPYFVGTVLGNIAQWAFLAYAVRSLGLRILTQQQALQAFSLFALVLPLFCL